MICIGGIVFNLCKQKAPGKEVIGISGAGNFTRGKLLPELKKLNANVKCISSETGLSASLLAKKFGIEFAASGFENVLGDGEINSVFVMTPHHLHAEQTVAALKAGKNVFVEKPLAVNTEQLDTIIKEYAQGEGSVMVGFNRRFSPYSIKAKKLLNNFKPEVYPC